MAPIPCFWLEKTLSSQRSLRRYARAKCSGPDGYHNATLPIDIVPFRITVRPSDPAYRTFEYDGANKLEKFWGEGQPLQGDGMRRDPRWPTKCDACSFIFAQTDHWQVFMSEIYRRIDTNEELTLRSAPAGAMWDAWWYGDTDWPTPPRPDGIHLMVRCPDTADGKGTADWYVDGKAGNAPDKVYGWERTGIPNQHPPSVTAMPSIQITRANGYHGWLKSGFLVPV